VGRSFLVGNDVHRGLLRAGCATVNTYVGSDEVGLHIRPNAFVWLNQAPGPLLADLTIIENFLVLRCVGIRLWNLVLESLVKRLVLALSDQL
jgi:hypothetical protein